MGIFTILPGGEKPTRGFSLLEILMALFIGVLILGLTASVSFESSPREQLEESMDLLERAVRFGMDEAVLRNRIVRIHFLLDQDPQQFTLEYAPEEDFVLSKKIRDWDEEDFEDLEEEEKKRRREILEQINKRFQPVEEFREEAKPLPGGVRVFGVGTTAFERLIGSPEASLFVYPTGEKDGALIVLGNGEEMGTLAIEEFTLDFSREWIENPPEPSPEVEEDFEEEFPTPGQWKKSKELFEKWLSPP